MFDFIKDILNINTSTTDSKLEKIPQFNREYILDSNNPFTDVAIVMPVEVKAGYVRYLYQHSNYRTGSSCTLETFNNAYKLKS